MKALKQWLVSLVRTEKPREFDPDTDRDIQRWRSIRRDARENRNQRRRDWLSEPLASRFAGYVNEDERGE